MRQLGIDVVLSKLNDTVDIEDSRVKSYGIRFITAEGNVRDLTVSKYTKGARQSISGQDKRGQGYYNLQRNGVVLLNDLLNGRQISVKTAMMFAFRDFDSAEWFKIFH